MMKHILAVALASLVIVGAEAKDIAGSRPNIILVLTDDQGPHLSYIGHPYLQTPHIDAFAKRSLRLNDFHVSPTCSPTRAAILSGRHEFKNGVTSTTKERELMALSTTTFPKVLRSAGYETGIFGKWHLGDPKPFRPSQRGFSEALTHGAGGIGQLYPGSNADFPTNGSKDGRGRYYDNVLLHNEQVVQTRGYCTDVFFGAALGWMKKQLTEETPFFAFISPNTPHSPLIATEESLARFRKRHPNFNKEIKKNFPKLKPDGLAKYYAMIENIDDNFGLMLAKLEEWGALENTLIIFTTDNGASVRHGGTAVANGGFKSGKGSVGEGGAHVPCLWSWKGVLPEDADVSALTAHIDFYKTFCDLAGAKIPDDIQEIDGRTLLPLLKDPNAEWADRALFITGGRWKLGMEPVRDRRWAVRTQRWRLVGSKLYDIANDPYEAENVADEHPEIVKGLTKTYHAWWEEVLPLMINEDRTWDGPPPAQLLYDAQIKKGGLPEWEPLPF